MKPSENYGTLDDPYWFDACKTVCKTCKHIRSFERHSCAAFPEELPPEYWNGEKKCPKQEEREPESD